MHSHRTKLTTWTTLATVAACLVAGCGAPDTDSAAQNAASSATAGPTEEQHAVGRLALSYDGGVLVYDADSLTQVGDIGVDGFVRLNSADNGRDVLVSESDGFHVLDMGVWTRRHGDHGHHYSSSPRMTDITFGGEEPGHAVSFEDRLTLFSDGTGEVTIVEPVALAQGKAASTTYTTPEPHHGVAVSRGDGSLVVTVGNENERSGIAILDRQRREITRSDECPGVHGEAEAANGVLTFGCENGILIVRGNEITKVASPDSYGRIGNQAGSSDSPIVLGDYKTDKNADLERPNRFTLTDTRTATLRVVPIDSSYSFRSIERGPDGQAVILGTDGNLHVFDPRSAAQVASIPVIRAWAEPDEWQSPMPNLFIQGERAYVSEPSTKTLYAVDLTAVNVVGKVSLPHETIELTGVTG